MNSKFLIYAVMVTALSTGVSWKKFIREIRNDQTSSSSRSGGGSGWISNTGSSYSGGGSHK